MKIGDKFILGRKEFTLISATNGSVVLVDNNSIEFTEPIKVKYPQNITREEFEEISDGWILNGFDKEIALLVESEKPVSSIPLGTEEKFLELWNKLVPQSGEPENIKGILVWSIGRLKHEWENNGNMNWGEFYLPLIENLFNNLISDQLNFEDDENKTESDSTKSFDARRNEQIKQDLKFIGLLGSAVSLNLTDTQTERVLQALWTYEPDENLDYDAPFKRILAAVVEWCEN